MKMSTPTSKKWGWFKECKIDAKMMTAKNSLSCIPTARTESHQHFPSLCMLNQCLHWPSAAVSLHTGAANTCFHGFQGEKGKKGEGKIPSHLQRYNCN